MLKGTSILVGNSGVGKSHLLNRLGEVGPSVRWNVQFLFVKVRCQDDKERNAWHKTSTRTWSVLHKIRVRKPDDFVTSVSKGPKKHRSIKHLKSTSQKPYWTLPEGADCRDGWQHQRKARDLSEFHLCVSFPLSFENETQTLLFLMWSTFWRKFCFEQSKIFIEVEARQACDYHHDIASTSDYSALAA